MRTIRKTKDNGEPKGGSSIIQTDEGNFFHLEVHPIITEEQFYQNKLPIFNSDKTPRMIMKGGIYAYFTEVPYPVIEGKDMMLTSLESAIAKFINHADTERFVKRNADRTK